MPCIKPFQDTFDKDNPPTTKSSKTHPTATNWKRLLMMGSLLAAAEATGPFELKSANQLRTKLRKHRSKLHGHLELNNIKDTSTLKALQFQWKDTNDAFATLTSNSSDAHLAILDTGASWSIVNDKSMCEPNSIYTLDKPMPLDGIAGGVEVTQAGTLKVETIDKQGNIFPIETKVLIHEQLPGNLLSPQALLANPETGRLKDHFRVYSDHMEWHAKGSHLLDINYDNSFLPRLTFFKHGKADQALAAYNTILHPSNSNLSPLKKLWMLLHTKAGHMSFGHVHKLAVGGLFGKAGLGLNTLTPADAPLCEACRCGKQARKPDGHNTRKEKPHKVGSLKINQLEPGQTIFMDQLESRLRGRLFHTAGKEPEADRFCGSTVFCDAASGYLHVEHQVTLNASDTINAKTSFERHLAELGVNASGYHTDNGVFKSAAFTQELATNYQSIKFSGVGAKWQNGVAENAIKIVVSRARTMMIYAALMWPEIKDETLWPLAVSHAVYLYNNTPNEVTGIAPIEIMSRSTSDGSALKNAKPWGCPAYVLEPKLTTAGGKIPKWKPRSRRGQYVGVSPVHAESVSLIRNLTTGYISPQYHIVFDEKFETIYNDESNPPPTWEDMCIFNRWETEFDESIEPPPLEDHWLTPEEASRQEVIRTQQQNQRQPLYHELPSKAQSPPDGTPKRPKPTTNPSAPTPNIQTTREASTPRELPTPREPPQTTTPAGWTRTTPPPPPPQPPPRRSARNRQPPPQLVPTFKGKSYGTTRHIAALAAAMAMTQTVATAPITAHLMQSQALGFDPIEGIQHYPRPDLLQSPLALDTPSLMKAKKKSKDPDLPSLRESLTGPYADKFWEAMDKEIASLESKGTWELVNRSDVPDGARIIPGTWTQRIKRHPDGTLNKFKSRWCFRGDLERKHYEGNPYSPLVGWPTIRAALLLSASHGWQTRQVDFTLAFCQSPQKRPVYMELPQHYRPEGSDNKDVVLKLKKSLHGQMDSPKLFYEHLCNGMDKLGFVPADSDPCLFLHKTKPIMVLNYCDDQIWLSPDNDLIEEYVEKLKNLGYDLTIEPKGDVFGFLGIEFNSENGHIELTQRGLIDKVINYTGMSEANSLPTPALSNPLGADKNGDPFDEPWNYAAAVGMLLYISSNTRPDIQFAVHQAARFTHNPKKSHAQAVERIIRYLVGTNDKGIMFKPDLDAGLDCYVDADFCGLYGAEDDQDPVSVKSRTGYTLTLFGCPIIWASKLQTEITLSSTAAEYVAFSMAMRELLPMRALLQEISSKMGLSVLSNSLVRSTVFEDNQGCLSLVNVPKMSTRNKYLALKYHFFRSHIGKEKGIEAQYIRTTEQKADIFTKGLAPSQFAAIRKLLIGW